MYCVWELEHRSRRMAVSGARDMMLGLCRPMACNYRRHCTDVDGHDLLYGWRVEPIRRGAVL